MTGTVLQADMTHRRLSTQSSPALRKADLVWNGKVLDVAAVRAGWTAGEDTTYKRAGERKKRARRE